VKIGEFTYKEKFAMESMIQQLERELFKENHPFSSGTLREGTTPD
jgi:hypothetical protein